MEDSQKEINEVLESMITILKNEISWRLEALEEAKPLLKSRSIKGKMTLMENVAEAAFREAKHKMESFVEMGIRMQSKVLVPKKEIITDLS